MTQPHPQQIPRQDRARQAATNPLTVVREMCDRSFYHFLVTLWPTVCHDPFQTNWHIKYLCDELQEIAERVFKREVSPYDLIANVPPGTTKTTVVSIMFPVWCWTRKPWMRFLTFSYNQDISFKPSSKSMKVIQSDRFQAVYPDLRINPNACSQSYYEIQFFKNKRWNDGGYRFSSSVTGGGTGLHGDINIVDDPLNPNQAASDADRKTANDFHEETLPSRKTIKDVTVTILIMQRLHEDDPTGFLLNKKKLNIKHVRLPADISDPRYAELVSPPELRQYYIDGLLDPTRMGRKILDDFEERLGQYGAAAQLGQNPSPPEGGMFKVDRMLVIDKLPPEVSMVKRVRAWDKAGTDPTKEKGTKEPAYTVGSKMSIWANGEFIVEDVVRGRWSANDREDMLLATAQADGQDVEIWVEQEPGSGGKESAEFTVRNLAGFLIRAERPVGNKVARADTFSVQVERYNVKLLRGDWNQEYINELKMFPMGKFKDQVDASSMAFAKLARKKEVWIGQRKR